MGRRLRPSDSIRLTWQTMLCSFDKSFGLLGQKELCYFKDVLGLLWQTELHSFRNQYSSYSVTPIRHKRMRPQTYQLPVCCLILPLRDEQSAASTRRVRGAGCLNLFLKASRRQKEMVPEMIEKWRWRWNNDNKDLLGKLLYLMRDAYIFLFNNSEFCRMPHNSRILLVRNTVKILKGLGWISRFFLLGWKRWPFWSDIGYAFQSSKTRYGFLSYWPVKDFRRWVSK